MLKLGRGWGVGATTQVSRREELEVRGGEGTQAWGGGGGGGDIGLVTDQLSVASVMSPQHYYGCSVTHRTQGAT